MTGQKELCNKSLSDSCIPAIDWNNFEKYVYHFTTFESAVKILTTKSLLFSPVEKLNDINESIGPRCLFTNENDEKEGNGLLGAYRQISFSSDSGTRRGFDIPAMWGHYASRGHGVCLVLDKKRIEEVVGQNPSRWVGKVLYSSIEPASILYEKQTYGDLDNFIRANKRELFFHKTGDWKYEQEYRIIQLCDNRNQQIFDISDSLVAVILHVRQHEDFLNSIAYRALSSICDTLPFYRYIPTSPTSRGRLFDITGKPRYPKEFIYDLSQVADATEEEASHNLGHSPASSFP